MLKDPRVFCYHHKLLDRLTTVTPICFFKQLSDCFITIQALVSSILNIGYGLSAMPNSLRHYIEAQKELEVAIQTCTKMTNDVRGS